MSKDMKTRKGKDGIYYPYTSPDIVIDSTGESQTTKNNNMKTDINTIKTDLGTVELTTTNKDIKGAINEVNAQYKDIANKIGSGNIGNNIEPQLMDMPRIYFSEGTLPTSKTATMLKFDYYSKTTTYHGYVDIKCQGNSSMAYPKKNFTIKPYKDKDKTTKLKIDFKGWGKQSKFVLKANWIDLTHARNVVSARLWGDIIKTRSDYATALPELLRTSPNQGAIDGFPVLVYSNGVYQGRYTLNIPKDKWMSNMDDALDTHCILCGEDYNSGCFRALPQINGSDWTDELHDVVPASIKTSWTNAIKFVMNSSDTEFKVNLSNYFDVNSLIDYYLYGLVATNLDGFGKNQLFFTYDGIHWIASVYDLDSTWGLWWNGGSFVSTTYSRKEFQDHKDGQGNQLYDRLEKLFIPQLKTRYAELRKDVLSASHIIQKFEEFNDVCPKDIVQEDYASTTGGGKFTGIPSLTTNNIQQLRNNIVGRLVYVDSYINTLHEAIPCTNITLNNATLSFTTSDAQTLIATLTPTDTTDKVVWSVSPSGICSVNDGVVTPISNGECVVTATCGSHSVTCNVTVNLPVEAVTALNLDKDSIELNMVEKDTTNVNLAKDTTYTGNTDFISKPITLSPGYYSVRNIGEGAFTWLGVYIDNDKREWKTGNTNAYPLILNKNTDVKIKGYKSSSNVVVNGDNLGVFKIGDITVNSVTTPFTRLKTVSLQNTDSGVHESSNIVNLNSTKNYILRAKDSNYIKDGSLCISIDNVLSAWGNLYDYTELAPIISNATKVQVSCPINYGLSNIELVECELHAVKAIIYGTNTLVASIVPTSASNKAVTWSSDNENVELLPDGLNCTVKAKAVGNSVVTCTSQDTTNGTITDTCNVTVTNV